MLVAIIDGAKIRKACGEMQMVSLCQGSHLAYLPLAAYLHLILHKNEGMIEQLKDVPAHVAAFKATGIVNQHDMDAVVLPAVTKIVDATGELNFMWVLDTSIKNFTAGAWFKDVLLGIQNLTKWNRAAIVTDSEGIQAFTEIFSKLMIGEIRGFSHNELEKAKKWVAGEGK